MTKPDGESAQCREQVVVFAVVGQEVEGVLSTAGHGKRRTRARETFSRRRWVGRWRELSPT